MELNGLSATLYPMTDRGYPERKEFFHEKFLAERAGAIRTFQRASAAWESEIFRSTG